MKYFIILVSSLLLTYNVTQTARVSNVVDGDTFDFRIGSTQKRVRLAHIDAPELKQHYGLQAQKQVEQLLLGKQVVFDSIGKDQYGRIVVEAKLNGKRIDSLLVRNGLAWYNKQYGTDAILQTAMSQAVTGGIGFWACGVTKVCPPWLFRGYNYKSKLKYCKGC